MLKRIFESARRVASGLAAVVERILDFHLALARHLVARFRRRFINADSPVFSFADERDFTKFCRALKSPLDPEIEEWIEKDLDPFESVTKFYHC
ncbi:unnamed protein product [marine sediment metagenome]|uniref:Uncharacterized protein n=1 Tax=marine sediment metagenome TaxID=412755 RepID=X0UZ78_9ZZZZ